MKTWVLVSLALTLGLAPSATPQAAGTEYKRLEIKRFACKSIPSNGNDGAGCLTMKDPGKIVWEFPACNWAGPGGADSTCVVSATSNRSGALQDIKATCSEKKFEKVARQCMGAHAMKQEFRTDTATPVCMSIAYKRDNSRIISRGEIRAPEGITVRELDACPAQ